MHVHLQAISASLTARIYTQRTLHLCWNCEFNEPLHTCAVLSNQLKHDTLLFPAIYSTVDIVHDCLCVCVCVPVVSVPVVATCIALNSCLALTRELPRTHNAPPLLI